MLPVLWPLLADELLLLLPEFALLLFELPLLLFELLPELPLLLPEFESEEPAAIGPTFDTPAQACVSKQMAATPPVSLRTRGS